MKTVIFAAVFLPILAIAGGLDGFNTPPVFQSFKGHKCEGELMHTLKAPESRCQNTPHHPQSIHFYFPEPQGRCYVRFHREADCANNIDFLEFPIGWGHGGCSDDKNFFLKNYPIGSYRWFCL